MLNGLLKHVNYIDRNNLSTKPAIIIKGHNNMVQAEMAELADALRSGRSELTLIRVQVPVSASFFFIGDRGNVSAQRYNVATDMVVGC